MLAALSSGSPFLFPLCIFAFFMAIGLSYDKSRSKTVVTIIDSLSRVFYHIAAFISEILALAILVLSASFAVRYRDALASGLYKNLLFLILPLTLVLSFIVLPLFLFILKPQKNRGPWTKVYGALGPAIAAFFSGDINFTLPTLFHHTKENLGVNRRINSVTAMLWTTFGRSGSAMIAAVAFVVILKSYSSMEITFAQTLQIWIRALILSFILGRNSADGAFAALAALCLWAPKGFETGYLILSPVAFVLISCGALIDCMTALLGSYAMGRMSPVQPAEKGIKNFV
jgi:Na+/H+-dicarboxylate symporter